VFANTRPKSPYFRNELLPRHLIEIVVHDTILRRRRLTPPLCREQRRFAVASRNQRLVRA
jgi:hypothetical protein